MKEYSIIFKKRIIKDTVRYHISRYGLDWRSGAYLAELNDTIKGLYGACKKSSNILFVCSCKFSHEGFG
jgi:hypothetical protein